MHREHAVARGDALLVPAGVEFEFAAAGGVDPLVFSLHRAAFDTLLAG